MRPMLNMCHIRKKNDLDHLHCDLDHVCKLGVGREEETKGEEELYT